MDAIVGEAVAIRVVHGAVPGRLRLHIASLYREPAEARRLEGATADLPGVRRARASTITATLLVLHDPEMSTDQIIAGICALDGMAPPPADGPDSRGSARRTAQDDAGRARAGTTPSALVRALRALLGREPRPHPAPATTGFEPRGWHAMDVEAICRALSVRCAGGLSDDEAARRLQRYGPNLLEATAPRSELAILLDQLLTAPVMMLAASAVVSVLTGGVADAAVILAVVGINSVIGWLTERQAEQTIRGLTGMHPRHCRVCRDERTMDASAADLVPGDLVLLAPGSWVAADLRLLATRDLSIDESALTGESLAVEKDAAAALPPDTAVAERANMAYMGTAVTGGTGSGLVVGTGAATELGRIQSMLGEVTPPQTPMEAQLGRLGYQLAILSGLVCGGVFAAGLARGLGWLPMLKASVSLAVAAVPEGLPAVATTTLAIGISRMRREQVAVRHLDAVETLGSVQVLCLDKTGTLTENRMTVRRVVTGCDGERPDAASADARRRLLETVSLCSEAVLQPDGSPVGSATEVALVDLARQDGLDVGALRRAHPLIELHQRAEGRPVMSSFHQSAEGGVLIAAKGSPGDLLERCTHVGDAHTPLDAASRERILRDNDGMAAEAMRVLGVACRRLPAPAAGNVLETRELVWLGLVGMSDPPRPGMAELMRAFQRAGIKTVMITGDQSATAAAVGADLALSGRGRERRDVRVLDSGGLSRLDPAMLGGLVLDLDVFARVSPAHKLRIVQAYQQRGRVVAMTGDGINDSPALKAADCGIAMGRSGTDVARSVADLVLEDDNLHSMLVAVRQGRTIYADIRKTIHFLLATNFTEIEMMLAAILLGLGSPLNPMQLLWINLLSDIFPGLALAMEAAEPGVMDQPPRDPGEPIVPPRRLTRMGAESAVITAGTMAAYGYALARHGPGAAAGTVAFNTLTSAQLLHAISCRSSGPVLWRRPGLPANPKLTLALGASLGAQLLANLVPGLRRLLGLAPTGLADLAVIAGGALLPLLINEATKPRQAAGRDPTRSATRSAPADRVEPQAPATPEVSAP